MLEMKEHKGRRNWLRLGLMAAVVAPVLVLAGTAPASAHGYVAGGDVTARAAMSANANRGAVQYEPQSLEAPKGFPAAGPADGQIASAGGQFGGNLDEQSATRWVKNAVRPGPVSITWTYTAAHRTSQWRYYLTTPGWDQNAPLARRSFEHIKTVEHDGTVASTNPTHAVAIPSDRNGYHVLLAVWDIGDTTNAFYNVIDLDVDGIAPPADTQAPTTPTDLRATPTSSRVALSWSPSSDDVAVVGYEVLRDGARIATTTSANHTDATVAPSTSYGYQVRALDAAGNASVPSSAVTVTTAAPPANDTSPPTAPVLHVHDLTATSVKLHWEGSTDDSGVTGYELVRDGVRILGTADNTHVDTGLTAGRTNGYQVRARDAAGNVSAPSNTVTVTTPGSSGSSDEQAPTAPSCLGATAMSATEVVLGWVGSADNVGVVRYDVYRGGDDQEPLALVGSTTEEAFTDTDVAADTAYVYQVKAVDAAGNATASSRLTVITPAAGTTEWDPTGSYTRGDVVSYRGSTYVALQSYVGNGDSNWIYAPSLWTRR